MSRDACREVDFEAALGDLGALLDLETNFPEADRISRQGWRRFLKKPRTVFVCRNDGKVLAAAVLLLRANSLKARLYSIAVAPEARGRGLGQALLAACERHARQNARNALSLEVRASNEAAINLYRKAGFEAAGVISGYYDDGENALRMIKSIENGGQKT